MAPLDPGRQPIPVRGQSPVGRRYPVAAMSRRDRSSVGNGDGVGCPKPFRGGDGRGASANLRVSRVSARMTYARFCEVSGLYVAVAGIAVDYILCKLNISFSYKFFHQALWSSSSACVFFDYNKLF